jgi:hypothetical protein
LETAASFRHASHRALMVRCAGRTRPVAQVVTHAGIVKVKRYAFSFA